MGEQEQKYMPIKALNQFSQVSIKARVMKKGFRQYSNARGSGHILNLDLMDREGTMIQATGFGQQAINFNDHVQQGSIYVFTNGSVKIANQRYTSIKNDFSITFDNSTVIELQEDSSFLLKESYNFTQLTDIEKMVQQTTIDVIGVVLDVEPT